MTTNTDPAKIEQLLTRRVEKVLPSKEALEKVLLSGKKLRLYQGFDPSSPNLHIGHLVGLLKLKEFQEMGHEVIFLIGDFTGMIGDPTGKIKGARPQLTHEEVIKNAQTYQAQAGKILNFEGSNPVLLKFNGEWLGKLSAIEAFKLMRHLTYAQIVKRDMFQERIKKDQDIFASEFMYPFMQGYDSVAMNVDLEIGGSDQLFNMLVGRDLLKKIKNKEKFVMTTKLLVDSSGNKIGKTEGNAINLANSPEQFFGQIMSLSDAAILPCFELITNSSANEIIQIRKDLEENPMACKKQLAFDLVKMLNDETTAQIAQKEFEKVHQGGGLPTEIKSFKLVNKNCELVGLLVDTELCLSRSEAKRLIEQGGVKINNEAIKQPGNLTIVSGTTVQAGKRKFVKII